MSGFLGYVGCQLVIEKDDRLVLSTGHGLLQRRRERSALFRPD